MLHTEEEYFMSKMWLHARLNYLIIMLIEHIWDQFFYHQPMAQRIT